jgi:hypothetical protein
LQYYWSLVGSNQPIATGIVAIVVLPVGTNSISLAVSDGAALSTNIIDVEVITTAQAVERLVATINSDVPRSDPLTASLYAAIASIERSNPTAAINQLQAFQNKVLAQLEPVDPEAAQALIQAAQEVIDTLNSGMAEVTANGPSTNTYRKFGSPVGRKISPEFLDLSRTDLRRCDLDKLARLGIDWHRPGPRCWHF